LRLERCENARRLPSSGCSERLDETPLLVAEVVIRRRADRRMLCLEMCASAALEQVDPRGSARLSRACTADPADLGIGLEHFPSLPFSTSRFPVPSGLPHD